ncbi:MAG TPA: polysaccharide deacetylase family protein, partial [Kamptonema sp.]|nr:polysaccharide deacetylase family protein [Kamptonema sp.]
IEGEEIGNLELPVCDGLVAGSVLADAIAAKFAWEILGKFFENTIWKGQNSAKELHNKIGWTAFLQDIWGRAHWKGDRFYDSQVWEETTRRSIDNGFVVIEISEEIPHLEVALPEIDVLLTIGGAAIGIVTVNSEYNFISSQVLRVALINATGVELCRACVREGLLGKPLNEAISLRSRLAQAKAKRQQQTGILPFTSYLAPPNYAVLGRHLGAIGTSASRRAMLPVAAMRDLLEMSDRAGSAIQVPPVVERILYAPDAIRLPSQNLRSLQPKIQHTTDLSENILTEKLPILMYRRIIPAAFEEQLRYLRDNGYYSIGWEDWLIAIASKTPLPGKAVLITFDGGYQDFYEYAWPLLKTYGFKATVFLVCDRVGKTNNWEKADSEEIQLMGWSEIRQLQQQEIDFGSLGITYQPLTTLSAVEIVREAARSRRILEQVLGVSIKAFAYPYGDFDPVVQHLIGACGYTFGVGSWSSLSSFSDNLLGLPRIEITGNDGLQEFESKLNLGW